MAIRLLTLLDQLDPEVRDAFLQSIGDIKRDFQIREFLAAYRAGDIERALRTLAVDPEYFAPLDMALRDAYNAGGRLTFDAIKELSAQTPNVITGAFGIGNERAQAWLLAQSSRLITEIVEDQREDIRRVLADNMQSGVSAQRAALDIVGRANPANGVRTGGILGLDTARVDRVLSVRAILSDPERVSEYFVRDRASGRLKTRYAGLDRRFDGLVKRAIAEGRAVDPADAERIIQRMTGRLLRERGETISRTELINSMGAARNEGLQQLVDSGKLKASAITLKWDSAEDFATRETHVAADNQERRFGEPHSVGGYLLRWPGDTELGAPGKEVIRCRCVQHVDIDFLGSLR